MPNEIIYGFNGQNEYERYLNGRGMAHGAVGDYVSLLNTISRILGRRLAADMVQREMQINNIAIQLEQSGELMPNVVNNCKTALRHYCRALNHHEPQ